MKKICVITGGGSGMGLDTAKLVGKDQKVIITGRTVSKLENAIKELEACGVEAEAFSCDVSKIDSVKALAEHAAAQGVIKTVIHAAGVSPHMTSGEQIFAINAVGTINVDEVFAPLMTEGGVILNVSSMSAYLLPQERIPTQLYQAALQSADAFLAGCKQLLANVPENMQTGMAYTISKNFVVWYTVREAVKYGKNGIRIVSISPGTFATPMGKVEGEEAAGFALRGALGRVGEPMEIAKMMAFIVSDEASYLTGTDILYDGGAIAAAKLMREQAPAK